MEFGWKPCPLRRFRPPQRKYVVPYDPTPIRMCVCAGMTFAEIRDLGIHSMEELREKFGISGGCGFCAMYVERMLSTGETAFAIDLEPLPEAGS